MIKVAKSSRNKAMVALQYETGCRVGSELLQMKIRDVYQDPKSKIWWAHIPSSKTFSRKFPLKESVPHLITYINTLNEQDNKSPLWQTYNDRINPDKIHGITGEMYNHIIKDLFKDANIDPNKPKHPYWIRHSGVYRNKKRFKSWHVFTKLHGWTENSNHARRYLHTDTEDIEQEFYISQGLRKREDIKLEVRVCSICGKDNPLDAHFCQNPSCNMPLDKETADNYKTEMQSVKEQLAQIVAKMNSLEKLEKENNNRNERKNKN